MPPAPVASGASPSSQIGSLLAGGMPGQGADAVRAAFEQTAQKISEIGQMVDAVAADIPSGSQEVSQIKNLLKTLAVRAYKDTSDMTASSQAVPAGASMGPGL